MKRFFVSDIDFRGGQALVRWRRKIPGSLVVEQGEQVCLVSDFGMEYLATIEEATDGTLRMAISSEKRTAAEKLILTVAFHVEGDGWEFTLAQLVEAGAAHVIPVVRDGQKIERPFCCGSELGNPASFDGLIENTGRYDMLFVQDPGGKEPPCPAVGRALLVASVNGFLEPEQISDARSKGFIPLRPTEPGERGVVSLASTLMSRGGR